MTKHTPGPWEVYEGPEDRPELSVLTVEPCDMVADFNMGDFSYRQNQANAHRAVACVNACEGINPEAIKDLLKVAKEAGTLLRLGSFTVPNLKGVADRVETAIAKVEGSEK